MKELFPGVFELQGSIATIGLSPGKRVYNEKVIKRDGREYRIWDPFRSKLCGAIKKGLKLFPFAPGSKILYLGASTGTTISHLSDIVGEKGEIYAVEISPQCMNLLLANVGERQNVIPIHASARQPREYEDAGRCDAIYMDVAQADQDDILIMNAELFLQKGGIAMLCIKSQSIDVTKPPDEVFAKVLLKLERRFDLLERMKLEPFDKDHLFVVLRYKG
jgi:fibrillarin-like pre-rRNA processing protein